MKDGEGDRMKKMQQWNWNVKGVGLSVVVRTWVCAACVWLILGTVAQAADKVVATQLTGQRIEGDLVAISPTEVKIASGEQTVTLPVVDLMDLEVRGASRPVRPRVWVSLTDGSLVVSNDLQIKGGQADLQLLSGTSLTVAAKGVRSIRLRAQDDSVAAQWKQIVEGEFTSDVLIIRKTTVKEAEEEKDEDEVAAAPAVVSLDVLEGRVLQMDAEQVQFEFEGEKIAVKREKIEGVLFFQGKLRDERPKCWLYDVAGSRLAVQSLALSLANGDKPSSLAITTVSSAQVSLPIFSVRKLDFSSVNMLELGGESLPLEVTAKEFDLQPKALAPLYEKLLAPQRFDSVTARQWKVQGKEYRTGLVVLQSGRISARLPADLRWFRGEVALADCSDSHAVADVRILLDGKEVWHQSLVAGKKGAPQLLAFPLADAKRLVIEVDIPKGSVAGAVVVLGEARVTK